MTTGLGGVSRILLRQLRDVMARGADAQARLDEVVRTVAMTMVADVCSIYLKRSDGGLELFATEGLAREAVHRTRMKAGEGLVGLIAETADPLNLAEAPRHPNFSYRPETGEDPYSAFLGVPILRTGRVLGVLVVQNRTSRTYGDEETEALQTIAMVLAEVVSASELAGDASFREVEFKPQGSEVLSGRRYADGLALGTAVLHDPALPPTRLLADDPQAEESRIADALARLRAGLEAMLGREAQKLVGVPYEVLETFHLLAGDKGWERRLREAVRAGLTAEAAVERVRSEHRARLQSAKDSYIRDRLQDLEELDNRLLRELAGGASPSNAGRVLPDDAVLIARNIGPAELLEYGAERLKAIVLEEGSSASHAAIVARAMGVPMIGQVARVLARVEDGDRIVVDASAERVFLRPDIEVVESIRSRIMLQDEARAALGRLRDVPCVTRDGVRVELHINAGLALDARWLAETGADGIGLFRTEFQFMVSEALPRLEAQTALYREVMDAAGDHPVTFRTLDLGGDKVLPYLAAEREENPALGWRAVRMTLDRPAIQRQQLRALIKAANGRRLKVMFPLIVTPEEFIAARALLDREVAWATARGRPAPASVEVGAMVETPALAWRLDLLTQHADFFSVGTNDLMQYFHAADRGNARVADRYDLLSPAALSFLAHLRTTADAAGKPISICGEAAGRPLEAMALIGLGFRRLSGPPAGVGAVKRMALSLDAGALAMRLQPLLASRCGSIRTELEAIAREMGVLHERIE
jgi:phosphotransferase system enzyme I (PtsP)